MAHPGGPLLYGMSVSSFLWTGIQSDRIWWKNLLVTNAGLSEEKKTRWQLFFKLTKQDAVRIEPARLRHRPAPKEGTQSYLWVMACEETWVELYEKSHGCALLPTAPNLRAVYIKVVQCDTSDMPIASKVLHLGIVSSESRTKTKMSRSCSGFRAAEVPKQLCSALEAAPRAKGALSTTVAPNKQKTRAAEEAEESDDDFAPKKGNTKRGMDTKTKSDNTNKKFAASMAKTKAPSQHSHQVKSITPPLLCACSPFICVYYSSIVLSQAIEIF